jgi:nucleotide-binding universal stress UspA family protein
MFDRIIVPYDGPEVLEAVLPALSRVIGQRDHETVLLKLERPVAGPPEEEAGHDEDVLARFFKDTSQVKRVRRQGTPVEEILAAVESADASLVAMATHGRQGLARLLFGSVIERVVRACPAPVLAVRASGDVEPRDIHTLLLPIDESLDWKASAACAADVARRHEASVVVLRATSPAGREAAERQVHELCGELVAAGAVTYAFVEEGAPAEVILKAGAEHEADMIVMATHSRRGLSRLRLGGVAEEILRDARVPVMTVPAALSTAWVPALVED